MNLVPTLQTFASYAPGIDYAVDVWERSILYADTLRRRGNSYLEHLQAGEPPLLKFEHELVLDGRDFARPCNYALLYLKPPADSPIRPDSRPVVVVDPRAGHGPGIGGFKKDSEVGMAMGAGHPVYFVTFRPQPEAGQTLWDVMQAEALFLAEVSKRHPGPQSQPIVIGNCQAGWAMTCLAARQPELFGALLVVGAPLSYWAGSSTLNPMRYSGAMLGGSWLAVLSADLGGGLFDGANLVANFENLNPAHAWWSKYYRLWAHVDEEAERFLDFERWWGGFFRMTQAEIETIVEQLFVGNQLARGQVLADGQPIDLKQIQSPIVVFASWGDNITPPPQALNWIIDTWGSERAIAAAGRVIVYVLHENVGHLGIFVGAEIARKEHNQIVSSLDVIERLPPGLYEMKVVRKDGQAAQRWEELEPGTYSVSFEYRTVQDIRELNPEGRSEEQLFSTVAQLSAINLKLYRQTWQPWIQATSMPAWIDANLKWHPLRWQRHIWSNQHPWGWLIAAQAEYVRQHRHPLAEQHAGHQVEGMLSQLIETQLNRLRDWRDYSVMQATRWLYGPFGWGAWLPPKPSDEELAIQRAQTELAELRQSALQQVHEGGFAQAVCRIVLASMISIGAFKRRSLRLARLLAQMPQLQAPPDQTPINWLQLMRHEARICAVAPVEALNALATLLPDQASREQALAVAAAVLMIEPNLHHPPSEIIEILIGMLNLDPDRVMNLAHQLTASLATLTLAQPSAPAPEQKKITSPAASKKPNRAKTKRPSKGR